LKYAPNLKGQLQKFGQKPFAVTSSLSHTLQADKSGQQYSGNFENYEKEY
jgi:hypothetical protein